MQYYEVAIVVVALFLVVVLICGFVIIAKENNDPVEWHDYKYEYHETRKEPVFDAEKLQSLDAQIEKNYRELERLDRLSIAKWKEIKRRSAEIHRGIEFDDDRR